MKVLQQLRRKKRFFLLTAISTTSLWLVFQSVFVEFTEEKLTRGPEISGLSRGVQHWQSDSKVSQRLINTSYPRSQQFLSIEMSPAGQLAKRVRTKCQAYLATLPRTPVSFPITTNRNYNLLFCPMCKLASTFWTKFFKMLEVYDTNPHINSPYDIPISVAKPTKERLQLKRGISGTNYDSYYKFMFVRDPYSRILSAYVDKLFAPNPTFWRTLSNNSIRKVRDKSKPRSKCGSDLTFEEYIQAIIHGHRTNADMGMADCHDASFIGYCHPCELKMDFIGKMEQISTDSNFLFQRLHLNRTIETLNRSGKQLADEDALFDTVNSPFMWKNDIKSCIPWSQALERIWRKLQIRGVIGKDKLVLTEEEAENMTKQEFLELIKKTQAKTSYADRKKQRTDSLIEIYSQVNIQYLTELKNTYRNDFDFFEYDNNPDYIFNINRSVIEHYGYLDL